MINKDLPSLVLWRVRLAVMHQGIPMRGVNVTEFWMHTLVSHRLSSHTSSRVLKEAMKHMAGGQRDFPDQTQDLAARSCNMRNPRPRQYKRPRGRIAWP